MSIYELKYKINKLELSRERINELNQIEVKKINIKTDNMKSIIKIINPNEVVGLNNRWDDCDSWLELLYGLHKMRNFDIFNIESFSKFIEDPYDLYDLPIVVKHNEEYYIDGNGKHRLTMAKCLGLKKVKVIMYY